MKLPATFDIHLLRTNYKKMALLLHPDRHTLDKESANKLFSILTDSYKYLKTELDGGVTSTETDWMTLKHEADQRSDTHVPATAGTAGFNIDHFNTKFSDTRLGDENDRGYSSWMQRLTPDAAAVQQKRRQQEGRQKAAQSAHDSVVALEPEALPSSTSVPHSELGTGRVRDFSRPADMLGRRSSQGYTDYKVAHMTASCLIDPEIVRARQQFNNIEEYERARSESASNSMTADERSAIARHEAALASREDHRLRTLRSRDELVSRHHAKIHMHALAQ